MDTQKLMAGFLKAKTFEDSLNELGSETIPSNFTMMQALIAAMMDNSLLSNYFLANEYKKHVPEESKDAKQKLAAKDEELASKQIALDALQANLDTAQVAVSGGMTALTDLSRAIAKTLASKDVLTYDDLLRKTDTEIQGYFTNNAPSTETIETWQTEAKAYLS